MAISPPSSNLALIRRALQEDLGVGDITTKAVVPPKRRIRAQIIAKAPGIVAGAAVAQRVFQILDQRIRCRIRRKDGQRVRRGDAILSVHGNARTMLAAERTALNFLGHLSGVATLTRAFVDRVKPYRVAILDTRKTLPGLRALEKYAVRVGGGRSHRASLSEAVLMKTNHLRALARGEGSRVKGVGQIIERSIQRAKAVYPRAFIEVEVRNLAELHAALLANPDAVLLDNWAISDIRKAILLRNRSPFTTHPSPLLEVSGGVTLRNVRAIAQTGVERISIGRLTHSAPALDVSLQVLP